MRYGGTDWDRAKIIHALRYLYLSHTFDDAFWSAIMSNVPSEGSNITRDYDRDNEVYFN